MIRIACAWTRGGLRRIRSDPHPYPRLHFFSRRASPVECARSSRPFPGRTARTSHTSQRPIAQKAPATANTIPGPSWLWLDPIYEPFRAYGRVQQRKPYTTQFISSLVIYFVGDIVAQSFAEPNQETHVVPENQDSGWVQDWSENRDWHRTGRALIIGGLSSIPAYKWFLWLGNNFNYKSKILSLATKVAVNQTFFTPIFNSYFFGMQSLLSGATGPEIIERIKNTVPTSCINSLKIWPIFTAFSFTYIPIQYRSIFGGVIAIGWQTYLSLLNQRAAAFERAEHGGETQVLVHSKAQEQTRDFAHEKQKCAA